MIRSRLAMALALACMLPSVVSAQDGAAPAATPVPNADLTAQLERLKLQNQILDEQRKMLASDSAENVKLPTGSITSDTTQVLPSAAKYVTLQAFGDVVRQVCTDIKDAKLTSLVVTDLDLRGLEGQRLATQQQLERLRSRTDQAADALTKALKATTAEADKPIVPVPGVAIKPQAVAPGAAPAFAPGAAFAPGIASLLLGLDAVGAVGKSLAGLSGLFKTDSKLATADVTIGPEVMRAALSKCGPGITIRDPSQTKVSAADLKIRYVEDLRESARALRKLLVDAKLAVPAANARIAELEEAKLAARAATLKSLVELLETYATSGAAVLGAAETALDKLDAVDEKSGISALVTLARMEVLAKRYFAAAPTEPNAAQLRLTIAYASGTSRISTAWWRNDRIDFSAGIAVTYALQDIASDDIRISNTYFVQDSWKKLAVDFTSTPGDLRGFSAP